MKRKSKQIAKIRKLEAEIKGVSGEPRRKGEAKESGSRLDGLLAELSAERALEIERLAGLLEEAREVLKSRRERTATTVHDLKVPITISLLNLELAEMETDPGEKENYLVSVRRELEFLLDTIGNLLDIEHGETEALQLKKERLDLKELVDGVIARMTVLSNDKTDLAILNDLPKRIPALKADRNKLVRLFNNLISNSVKYTDSGMIRVGGKANKKAGTFTFFVRDTGQGIEPDRLPQLFEFFRGDALRQDSSGIGLAFVKQVVAAHGGRVWLESERGKGTVVYVELPVG